MISVKDDFQRLSDDITTRLITVNLNARRYRRLHTSLVVLTLVCGLLATTLAADSAMDSKIVATTVAEAATGNEPSTLPKGWRVVCGTIAVISLIGTVSQGIHSLLKIAEHRSKALDCAGRLDALTIELNTARKDVVEKVRNEYAAILREFPEYVR